MNPTLYFKNITCICLVATLLSCSPTTVPAVSAPEPVAPVNRNVESALNTAILQYVNQHRRSIGLQNLQTLSVASEQAYIHSKNMATGKTSFSHNGFEQRVQTISQSAGKISASAENVALGQLTAREVVNGWLKSPGHKKNIEGNYTLSGIGVAKDRDGVSYFTQIFLRK